MNIDLDREELAQLVRMCEALPMIDAVARIHHKASACLKNFSDSDTPLEPQPAQQSSQQWRSPI